MESGFCVKCQKRQRWVHGLQASMERLRRQLDAAFFEGTTATAYLVLYRQGGCAIRSPSGVVLCERGSSMRKLLVAVALIGLIAVAGEADNPKPAQDKGKPAQPEKPVVSLKVGDPAPALKASKWLQGEEVKE